MKDWTFKELWERLPIVHRRAMKASMQDPIWHPEGDCEIHTNMVFDYAKKFNDPDLLICAIFHDLGKPETQSIRARKSDFKGDVLSLPWKDQKISNLGHEYKSKVYIDKYFDLFSDVSTNIEKVKQVCEYHLRAHLFVNGTMKKSAKRQFLVDLKYFDSLIKFEECDTNGKSLNEARKIIVKKDNKMLEKLKADKKSAMLEKNVNKRTVLSTLIGEIETKNKIKVLNEAEIMKLINKMIKNNEDFGGEQEKLENEYLTTLVPKMLSEDEMTVIVTAFIEENKLSGMKSMGRIMGFMNQNYSGEFDGKEVSTVARKIL